MDIPQGFDPGEGRSKREYTLLLHGNVYGQKQAAQVWYQHLVHPLEMKTGFTKSKVDDCIYYKGDIIYILYTDNSIFLGPIQEKIDAAIEDIKRADLNIIVKGDVKDFLDVKIEWLPNRQMKFSQPHLIDKVLQAL